MFFAHSLFVLISSIALSASRFNSPSASHCFLFSCRQHLGSARHRRLVLICHRQSRYLRNLWRYSQSPKLTIFYFCCRSILDIRPYFHFSFVSFCRIWYIPSFASFNRELHPSPLLHCHLPRYSQPFSLILLRSCSLSSS